MLNANIKYLNNLDLSLNEIINELNKINKMNKTNIDNAFDQAILYLGKTSNIKLLAYNKKEHADLLHYLTQTKFNIIRLKNNMPNYDKKISLSELCDQYILFHNNLIKKIKTFLDKLLNYFSELEQVRRIIVQQIKNLVVEINDKINTYDHNLIYAQYSHSAYINRDMEICEQNFTNRCLPLKSKLDELIEYEKSILNLIENYLLIKEKYKNIDKTFLLNLKSCAKN